MFRRLRKIKPGWWFSAYFAAIPLFALLYWHYSDDFYEPNAVRELQAVALKHELESDLKNSVDRVYEYARSQSGGDEFSNLSVSGLRCDEPSEISFVTSFYWSFPKSFAWRRYAPVWHLDLPPLGLPDIPTGMMLRIEKLPLYVMYGLKTHNELTQGGGYTWGPLRSGELEPTDPEKHFLDTGITYGSVTGHLTLPPEMYKRIEDYQSVCYGSPTPLKLSFLRFAYLSGATITTLGYGDIIPINDFSRGLVILEAIFGVILIGLFLNSLADDR